MSKAPCLFADLSHHQTPNQNIPYQKCFSEQGIPGLQFFQSLIPPLHNLKNTITVLPLILSNKTEVKY